MNAAKAKRRWIRWCRYVDKTQTAANGSWRAGAHAGQTKAYYDVAHAKRYAPIGLRPPWYPRWAWPR